MADNYYPPGAFYFSVAVIGSGSILSLLTGIDASFQEVSGIQSEFGFEDVGEGGENRYKHRLPLPAKYSNLVLRRGVVTTDSFLSEWVGQTIGSSLSLPIITQNLLVTLLNDDGIPLIAWGFVNAYPLKWEFSAMNSQENKILTEKMEFTYNYFERVTLGSPASVAIKLAQLAARMAL